MKSAFITHLILNQPWHKDLAIQILVGLGSLKENLNSGDRLRSDRLQYTNSCCGLCYPLASSVRLSLKF